MILRSGFSAARLCALALLLLLSPAFAQRQATQWRFGTGAGIVFHPDGSVTPVLNSPMTWGGSCVSIADPKTGELLFFSDGVTVWDRTGTVMVGGDSISGVGESSHKTQTVLALPQPGSPRHYALFTAGLRGVPKTGYGVSFIDMVPNGGRGVVTARNVPLWPSASCQLTAVRMCGRDGYWVIGREAFGRFVIWPFDANGVGAPHTQDVGVPWTVDNYWPGYMKASVDGRRIAVALYERASFVEVIDFDPATGRLADTVAVRIAMSRSEGVSFSPDGRKLYVSELYGGRVQQFDVSTNDSLTIERSRYTVVTSVTEMGALQLGPNGRLYCATALDQGLGVITNPDSAGPGAVFEMRGVRFPRITQEVWQDLPNFVESDLGLRRIPSPSVSICSGDSIRLEAGWVLYPRWEPASTLSCASCLDPIAAPTETTTFYLFSGSATGCGPVDSVTVTVHPPATYVARGDTLLCRGESTELEVVTSSTVFWEPSPDLSCTDCRRVVATPRTSGTSASIATYRYRVTSEGGCITRDSIRVVVMPPPVVSAGRDTTICEGRSVELRASGGVRYQWSPSSDLTCTDCPDPIATPTVTTQYRVTAWDDFGCSASAVVRVSVAPPTAVDAGEDQVVCTGASARLRAAGADEYVWDATESLSCLECPDPVATPAITTTYYVTGRSSLGCSARDSVRVVVRELPSIVIRGDSMICRGGTARLSVEGALSYRWWTPSLDTLCTECSEQTVGPIMTTTYFVEGTNEYGCSRIDSITVRVLEEPTVGVSGGGEICIGTGASLTAWGASSYRWTPAEGLSCLDCPNPVASPPSTTSYTVIGTLPGGCSDTATVTVSVVEPASVIASIDRTVKLLPGEIRTLAISTDRALLTDSVVFEMAWNARVASVDAVRPASALGADGWIVDETGSDNGRFAGVLRRATPSTIAPGPIVDFTLRAFLGDSIATEIALVIGTPASSCAMLEGRAGRVTIDSICGLSFRLIEASAALLKLSAPIPTPVTSRSGITYSLPFDGHIELILVDARGVATTLEKGYRSSGQHQISLDTDGLAGGLYDLRLMFGETMKAVPVVIVK